MTLSSPYVAVETRFLLQKSYPLFPWHYALSSSGKTQSLVSLPGIGYIVPTPIAPTSWDHLKVDYPFLRSNVPIVLQIPVPDVRNWLTQVKGVASARSKHLQSVEGGKHVRVATLLWNAMMDVTILPVDAVLSFATYVLHIGRLVVVPGETDDEEKNSY